MEEKIQNIIMQALKNLADELENPELENPNVQTKIYGNLPSSARIS